MSMPTLERRWAVADLEDLPNDGHRSDPLLVNLPSYFADVLDR